MASATSLPSASHGSTWLLSCLSLRRCDCACSGEFQNSGRPAASSSREISWRRESRSKILPGVADAFFHGFQLLNQFVHRFAAPGRGQKQPISAALAAFWQVEKTGGEISVSWSAGGSPVFLKDVRRRNARIAEGAAEIKGQSTRLRRALHRPSFPTNAPSRREPGLFVVPGRSKQSRRARSFPPGFLAS